MMRYILSVCFFSATLIFAFSCNAQKSPLESQAGPTFVDEKGQTIERIQLSDEEWAKRLDAKAFEVLRKQGTERAFSNAYWDNHKDGIYVCAACGLPLFDSDTKFNSGTGWPSFFKPIDSTYVARERDSKFGILRTEVLCNKCGGHLGHVFDDGPAPTGLRYCMNSASLDFKETGTQ